MKSTIADFPDWFGPMLVKELRQGLKTKGFVLSFIGLQLVLILVLIYHVLLYSQNAKDFDATSLGVIFWMLIGGLLLIVTPLRAFNELAAERKANTLELIFMSGLSAWRITFGKWISLLFQALLFVLAVLPYAILRYYFGGVDLASDLGAMCLVMLCCAVLSAVALAISGLPLWVRILAAVLVALVIMPFMWAITQMFSYTHSVSRFLPSGLVIADVHWWLVLWNVVLVSLAALQVGTAAIAPMAENHAGRQRFLALLLWAPVPIMHLRHAGEDSIMGQLFLFGFVASTIVWYHLSTMPQSHRSICRPFAGWRAPFGALFQPGWPSALLYLLLVMLLVQRSIYATTKHDSEREWLLAGSAMIGASLLCATLVWQALRRRAKHPLVEESLFIILCGVLVAMLMAGKASGTNLGEYLFFGFIPPMAFWAMMDVPSSNAFGYWEHAWKYAGLFAFGGYALILLQVSRGYWWDYFSLCRTLGRPEPKPLEP